MLVAADPVTVGKLFVFSSKDMKKRSCLKQLRISARPSSILLSLLWSLPSRSVLRSYSRLRRVSLASSLCYRTYRKHRYFASPRSMGGCIFKIVALSAIFLQNFDYLINVMKRQVIFIPHCSEGVFSRVADPEWFIPDPDPNFFKFLFRIRLGFLNS